ncbi:ribosomal protein L13 family protein [Striga asiatica]|uniref:Ribosomal protein L13 family protein n=1 Tax=Striga asiatica TaxID=4170 RepID=A0A5A7QYX2_STRAF|nr:ribosomal protein L13 family protein [Striga asiatica]
MTTVMILSFPRRGPTPTHSPRYFCLIMRVKWRTLKALLRPFTAPRWPARLRGPLAHILSPSRGIGPGPIGSSDLVLDLEEGSLLGNMSGFSWGCNNQETVHEKEQLKPGEVSALGIYICSDTKEK